MTKSVMDLTCNDIVLGEQNIYSSIRYFTYDAQGNEDKVYIKPITIKSRSTETASQCSDCVTFFHYDDAGNEIRRLHQPISMIRQDQTSTRISDSPDLSFVFGCRYKKITSSIDDGIGNATSSNSATVMDPAMGRSAMFKEDQLIMPVEDGDVTEGHDSIGDTPCLAKSIPVYHLALNSVPWLSINKAAPTEWQTAQEAFLLHCMAGANPSVSDTTLLVSAKKPKFKNKLRRRSKSLTRLTKKKSGNSNNPDKDKGLSASVGDRVNHKSDCINIQQAGPCIRPDLNDKFVQLQLRRNAKFTATLYMELPPTTNFDLCHVKTELLVGAMLNFLYPYHDVQCLWVRNIQERLLDLLKDRRLHPRFQQRIILHHFQAVMVLSQDAAGLIRTRESGFLQSLAVALEMDSNKLLVLYKGKELRTCFASGKARFV